MTRASAPAREARALPRVKHRAHVSSDIVQLESTFRHENDISRVHIHRPRRLTLEDGTQIKNLSILFTFDHANHAHFAKGPKLISPTSLHDGLQDGGRSVKSVFPRLFHCATDRDLRHAAFQSDGHGRILELWLIEYLQSLLQVSDRSTRGVDLSNKRQIDFSVALNFLRLIQLGRPQESQLDYVSGHQRHGRGSRR